MIVIEGTIRVADLAKARPHMKTMIQASRKEPGCIDYAYAIDIVDPTLIRVVERWQDRHALDRHINSAHIQSWRSAWPDIGVTDRSLRLYDSQPEDF